jgi:uncharacterized membrane protein
MTRRLILFLLLTATCLQSRLLARSLVIESFECEIRVNTDATLDVLETIRPKFSGAWNGIYRTIPLEYRTPQGFNYTLLLDLEGITDENNRQLKYESSRSGAYRKFKIWVPGAVDTTRTVRIHYRVLNGLRFFDQPDETFSEKHDELYWNITGNEWEIPIESASARIYLPPGTSGLRALAFIGVSGSREQVSDIELGQDYVQVRCPRKLEPGEGLTAAIGWKSGIVHRPGAVAQAGLFLRSNIIFIIPLLVFPLMWRHWYRRGRDPRLRPIAATYEPPGNLTPAELGTLIDNRPDIRDITASIVDLAVRGYILIEESKQEQFFGLFSKSEYTFHRRKPASDWSQLLPHEQKLLEGLFQGRETVMLSELQNKFYKELSGIKDRIYDQLVARRFYLRRPDRVKVIYVAAGIAIGFLVGFVGAAINSALGAGASSAVVAGLLTGGIIVAFAFFMPARTAEGARALEGVLGFEEFLTRVESDRFERVIKTPQMFEKYLPFAMALGVEKNWAGAFRDIYRQPPEWYRGAGYHTFQPSIFASDLSRMSTQAASAMSSAPRSSGSSGFGGGGSSGGGFGGGGGGGF